MRNEDRCDPHAVADLVRSGEPGALDRIAHCYLDHLRGVGRCACRDPQDADDAVHDALLAAREKLDQFRGDGTVEAWLSAMVVNACRVRGRGRKNDPSWNRPLEDAPEPRAEDVHECVARRELIDHLARALAELPDLDRRVFLMAEQQRRTSAEIAAELGTTPAAIRARLTRIRRTLRSQLEAVWASWRA